MNCERLSCILPDGWSNEDIELAIGELIAEAKGRGVKSSVTPSSVYPGAECRILERDGFAIRFLQAFDVISGIPVGRLDIQLIA